MAPSGADSSWVVERVRAVQADVVAVNRLLNLLLRLAEIADEVVEVDRVVVVDLAFVAHRLGHGGSVEPGAEGELHRFARVGGTRQLGRTAHEQDAIGGEIPRVGIAARSYPDAFGEGRRESATTRR